MLSKVWYMPYLDVYTTTSLKMANIRIQVIKITRYLSTKPNHLCFERGKKAKTACIRKTSCISMHIYVLAEIGGLEQLQQGHKERERG